MTPESLHRRIGALIAMRRNELRLSQEQLAASVGISRASLANIERGRQSVLVHHIYSIGRALDLDPRALLPEVEEHSEPTGLPLPKDLKPEQKEIVARLFTGPATKGATSLKEGSRGKPKK